MGDGKIKSALEKALERAATFPRLSDEELQRMEYVPKGQVLAGKFLNNNGITDELASYSADKLVYIYQGMEDTLLKNIALPEDDNTMHSNIKALEGFYLIKEDKLALQPVVEELQHLFNYYRQAVEQTKASVQAQLFQKFQAARQQLEAQYGQQVDFDMEKHPEYRNEMLKVIGQLNQRFEGALQATKDKIKAIK
ncbi:DUF6657 family protein [Peptococcaceae bacterium 1198_IL3148]